MSATFWLLFVWSAWEHFPSFLIWVPSRHRRHQNRWKCLVDEKYIFRSSEVDNMARLNWSYKRNLTVVFCCCFMDALFNVLRSIHLKTVCFHVKPLYFFQIQPLWGGHKASSAHHGEEKWQQQKNDDSGATSRRTFVDDTKAKNFGCVWIQQRVQYSPYPSCGSIPQNLWMASNSVGPSSLLDTKLTLLTWGIRARQLIMPSGP